MAWIFDEKSPIYIQLAQRIKMKIISGELHSGDQLPTVRELAEEAGVNPNTTQRAYKELEQEGLVFTTRTSGRYVTENDSLLKKVGHDVAYAEIESFVANMKNFGFTEDEILSKVKAYVEGRQ
ncbi:MULTISPECIES: GntR family transcriptional regulator [unclassified Streptococcus]|uniref:GntR family transcriptional regulator n=1 Tax=unclassified Streptococcus TaxID=2608887 RepID=UPI0011B5E2C7|nr:MULTISPECIES: GntR family transcriptional regulator [unclassified Streptococcus]TWS95409.1 GntR family transcriptional regulator [Streptococcus sp. sy018]TWT16533.1 GntR family transcriptional regulator [Streptococcus sp. sy010]